MTIRSARRAEAPRLLEIWEAAVRATHHFLGEEDIAFYRRVIRDNYLPTAEVFVQAESGDRADAFLGLNEMQVEALFVHPKRHGCGLGRSLLQHARGLRGALTVDVNEQNESARAFYSRLGFVETGRSPLDHQGRPFPLVHMRWD